MFCACSVWNVCSYGVWLDQNQTTKTTQFEALYANAIKITPKQLKGKEKSNAGLYYGMYWEYDDGIS